MELRLLAAKLTNKKHMLIFSDVFLTLVKTSAIMQCHLDIFNWDINFKKAWIGGLQKYYRLIGKIAMEKCVALPMERQFLKGWKQALIIQLLTASRSGNLGEELHLQAFQSTLHWLRKASIQELSRLPPPTQLTFVLSAWEVLDLKISYFPLLHPPSLIIFAPQIILSFTLISTDLSRRSF